MGRQCFLPALPKLPTDWRQGGAPQQPRDASFSLVWMGWDTQSSTGGWVGAAAE